jgi:hypothetical protein
MTQRIRWIALLGIFFLAAALPGFAADDVTLEGGFVWERSDGNREGDIKATLIPTGDGEWNVSFEFEWEDGPHVYTGSCEGSLSGEFSGNIAADGGRKMKFKFSGAFEDGTFSGTHSFVNEDGTTKESGTLTLAAASADGDKGHGDDDGHGDGHGHDHGDDDGHDHGDDDGHGHD